MKPIEIQGETPISVTDYEAKAKHIIDTLDNEIFNAIDKEDCFETTVSKSGSETKKKRSTKKNELMPTLSPSIVAYKLERLLRVIMPMSEEEARLLTPQQYLDAYGYYNDVLIHINKYLMFSGNKQLLSAFVGITTDIYNTLCGDPYYSQVFKVFEDGLVGSSFTVVESGLTDTKATISRLTTKGAGQDLVKSPEHISIVQNNRIDKAVISARLDEFTKMIEGK